MSDREHIKLLAKEADVYRSQGLLEQSKEKYSELFKFIRNHKQYSKDKKLIAAVEKKMKIVDKGLAEVNEMDETPELSEDVQNLIGKLFAFSNNKDTAAIEGALALAKFGQHEKAISELERLMKEGNLPLLAAKNILRCLLNFASPEDAVARFNRWIHRDELLQGDKRYLRGFLANLLKKRGITADLPQIEGVASGKKEQEESEEEDLEISSVSITLMEGPDKGQLVEFEVSFQTGNTISLFIPSEKKELADSFKSGTRIPGMQCFSSLAFFNVTGVVSKKTKIASGPKMGDYSLDILMEEG